MFLLLRRPLAYAPPDYGQCLEASNDPGTTGKVGKLVVALIDLAVL